MAARPFLHRRRRRRFPVVVAAVLAVAGGVFAVLHFRAAAPPSSDPVTRLLDQMHQAAGGTVVSPHALGGALSVAKADGRVNVTAESLPPDACVQAGWQLVREGTVIINGVLPQRVSGAKLAELCTMDPKGATLVWAPGN